MDADLLAPMADYDPQERPGIVIAYVVGPYPIGRGWQVGLDDEGLLVPISRATCFVGISNASSPGEPKARPERTVGVTTCGSFVFEMLGWRPTLRDLKRAVWSAGEVSVAGAPLRTAIPVGVVVGVEATSTGRPGVRVKIDAAASRCLPPLPGKTLDTGKNR